MAPPPPPHFDTSDAALYAMQIQRYQQAVRSTMVLPDRADFKISLKGLKSKSRR